MHYAYQATIEPTHTVNSPLEQSIKLGSGILKRVQIFFPSGCNQKVMCSIWNNGEQIVPTNPDGFYSLDGSIADAMMYHNLDQKTNQLWFVGWSTGTDYDHTLSIMLDVQGPDEPDVNNLMMLMRETIERLISLMRSVF